MTSRLRQIENNLCVACIDDERKSGNGIIITLRKGWTFDPLQDNRVAGADTVTEAQALLSRARTFDGPFTA